MQEVLLQEFSFKWSAARDGWAARKRQLQAIVSLPHVKRQKRPGPSFADSGEGDLGAVEDQSCVHISRGEEEPLLYPCVVYEEDIATVKLGVGQMVMLEGCAMVQLLEGQAAMLGYSFPRGADVLVCSSSELTEVVTIEAGRGSRQGSSLGCQLRFASHRLGQQQPYARGAGLSFRLEFVGSLDSSLGKKMDNQLISSGTTNEEDDQPAVLVEDTMKKRRSCGQNTDDDSSSSKRQRVVGKLGSCFSSTSSGSLAMQTMLESLHLLGS